MENKNPIVKIEMENGDVITCELYPETAPKSVENFLSLVNKGFYDGLVFHRIIDGFMIQGGCPLGNGTGGPGYQIFGEFEQNGFRNDLKHERGVLSMARSGDPNSAGSQFFIMTSTSPHLDGAYAAFGKVTDDSLDAVDRIVKTPTPRSEIYSGKNPDEIKDADGNPISVHQGNADTPLAPQRMAKVYEVK